jgi:integrase
MCQTSRTIKLTTRSRSPRRSSGANGRNEAFASGAHLRARCPGPPAGSRPLSQSGAGAGVPLSVESVSRRFGQLAERVGLADVRLHDIRHAFATRLLEHGVQPKVVSEAPGHASIGITLDTYSHVMPTMSQVAADALEEVFGK